MSIVWDPGLSHCPSTCWSGLNQRPDRMAGIQSWILEHWNVTSIDFDSDDNSPIGVVMFIAGLYEYMNHVTASHNSTSISPLDRRLVDDQFPYEVRKKL